MQAIDNGERHHGGGSFEPGPTPQPTAVLRSRDDALANWLVVLACAGTTTATVISFARSMHGRAATFAEMPPITSVITVGLACSLVALVLSGRRRAARISVGVIAGTTLVLAVGAGVASFLPVIPSVFAPFLVRSPLRGLVLDLSMIAALLVALGRAR